MDLKLKDKTALHVISRGLVELTKGSNVTDNTIMPGLTYSERRYSI
mgnify:CR=1 FL=1